jgi:hypothetical protein
MSEFPEAPLHRRKLSHTRESDITNSPFPVVTRSLMAGALSWGAKEPDIQSNPLVKHLVVGKALLHNVELRLRRAMAGATQTDRENVELMDAMAAQLEAVGKLLETWPLVVK